MQSLPSSMNTIQFNLLYIDKYSFGRVWVYPESAIPYNMLRYIINGSAEFVVNGETVTMRGGQVYYTPEGYWLSRRALEDTFTFCSIRFATSVSYEGASFFGECYNSSLAMDMREGIEPYFSDIYKRVRTDKKSKSFHAREALDTLIASPTGILNSDEPDDVEAEVSGLEYNLGQIRKGVEKSATQTDPRVQTVIDYITLSPTEEYTSDKLGGMAEVVETTFRRLFKEAIGKTAAEFMRQVRLTTTAKLLLISNDPVNCIAHSVGLEDTNHLTRVFRQAFGMTLGRYGRMSQEQG